MGERNSHERLIGNVTTKQCHHHGKPELCAPSGTEYAEPCQRMNDLHLSEHSENVERESAASTSEISPSVQATANMAKVSVSTAIQREAKMKPRVWILKEKL
ncbi:baculoviral IAP repeat-containing protein 2-like isoform X3 [Biomphalaria glabrata]|nr:baculoviral IAP repeat-containing protein 2-like isoform X3 [Biomphalaria glabrata]